MTLKDYYCYTYSAHIFFESIDSIYFKKPSNSIVKSSTDFLWIPTAMAHLTKVLLRWYNYNMSWERTRSTSYTACWPTWPTPSPRGGSRWLPGHLFLNRELERPPFTSPHVGQGGIAQAASQPAWSCSLRSTTPCRATRLLCAGAVGAALHGTGHFYSQLRFGSVPAPANQHQYSRYVRYVGPEGPHHLAARLPRQANRFENKIKSASCATRGCYAVVIYRPKGQRCQHSEDLQAQNHSSIVYITVKSKTVSTSCPFLNKKFVLYRSLVSACRSTKGKSQSRDCVD